MPAIRLVQQVITIESQNLKHYHIFDGQIEQSTNCFSTNLHWIEPLTTCLFKLNSNIASLSRRSDKPITQYRKGALWNYCVVQQAGH